MFTVEQIKAAHSKVKSGADFPNYVQDLIKLGVTYYETSSAAKYATLSIAQTFDVRQFSIALKAHQQGQTDYATFCSDCAKLGVLK